jgi:hypothetical protein
MNTMSDSHHHEIALCHFKMVKIFIRYPQSFASSFTFVNFELFLQVILTLISPRPLINNLSLKGSLRKRTLRCAPHTSLAELFLANNQHFYQNFLHHPSFDALILCLSDVYGKLLLREISDRVGVHLLLDQ